MTDNTETIWRSGLLTTIQISNETLDKLRARKQELNLKSYDALLNAFLTPTEIPNSIGHHECLSKQEIENIINIKLVNLQLNR